MCSRSKCCVRGDGPILFIARTVAESRSSTTTTIECFSYRCKDRGPIFSDKTVYYFAHMKIGLDDLLFAFDTLLRDKEGIRHLELISTYRINHF